VAILFDFSSSQKQIDNVGSYQKSNEMIDSTTKNGNKSK
jgi:hypothetical protein